MVHAVVAAVDIECQVVFSFSRIVPHPRADFSSFLFAWIATLNAKMLVVI
jgi:hypothetical protein